MQDLCRLTGAPDSRAPVPGNRTRPRSPGMNVTSPSGSRVLELAPGGDNICPVEPYPARSPATGSGGVGSVPSSPKADRFTDTTPYQGSCASACAVRPGCYAPELCGWESIRALAQRSDSCSRAFAEFAEDRLAEPPTRGADHGHHAGAVGRSRVTQRDGDRGA